MPNIELNMGKALSMSQHTDDTSKVSNLNAKHNDNSSNNKNIEKNTNENDEDIECVICLDAKPNILSINCGHSVMCKECSQQFCVQSATCPVCREPAKILLNVFEK